MNDQIRKDLSRKLQTGLGALFQREIEIAKVVLSPADTNTLLFEAAVMMVRTAAASIAASAESVADVEKTFDVVVEAVFEAIKASRSKSLTRIHEELRKVGA
ncbi:hypothetical protein [Sphingomonas solaris]|uniref:Uncharacterized protein n=1 Tax=Alterirhizorhabdus solaris TaxID=2529389 RepID=A0A558R7D6_9SPHN|nr:hypothetical protein [Sphingomonas solaris]TVV75309.1 hypothetical protein FOY91_07630 [Sphingomonas solaris]